jgi:hypothetical protein
LIIYRSFDSNETVSNDLFKEVMIQYIWYVEEYSPKYTLIDMQNSTYVPDPSSFPAIDKMMIDLYNRIGLKKRAFVWGVWNIEYIAPSESEHNYQTKWFWDSQSAISRLITN